VCEILGMRKLSRKKAVVMDADPLVDSPADENLTTWLDYYR
jgi:hypothetical protein